MYSQMIFRYVIPNSCKLKFRVLLKTHICPNAKSGHFLIFNTDFFDIYLKTAQNGSFLSILSRFWLIFSSDKPHSQRGSRLQKVSKSVKNGGENTLKSHFLPFFLKYSPLRQSFSPKKQLLKWFLLYR